MIVKDRTSYLTRLRDLAKRGLPGALIKVDRDDFLVMLKLYDPATEQFIAYRQWKCAVGAEAYRTPTGDFQVTWRARRPSWVKPTNVDWVEPSEWGQEVRYGDPENPIKGRWIGFHRGVGFHGTADLNSIGTPASHGCVRMRPEDVIELFPFARKGTVVQVTGKQPKGK